MEELSQIGSALTYSKGEIIRRPSDESEEIFLLTDGIACAYTISATGDKHIQYIYGRGEVFPVAQIVGKILPSVYYEAITDCRVIRMPAHDVVAYMGQHADSATDLLTTVVKQFITYKARVDVLENRFARERVAYQLLLLGRRFGSEEDGEILMPHFSQDVLAESCNVSRESVNRELKRFERHGLVTREPGKLRILDPVGLRKEIAPLDTPLFIDDP